MGAIDQPDGTSVVKHNPATRKKDRKDRKKETRSRKKYKQQDLSTRKKGIPSTNPLGGASPRPPAAPNTTRSPSSETACACR